MEGSDAAPLCRVLADTSALSSASSPRCLPRTLPTLGSPTMPVFSPMTVVVRKPRPCCCTPPAARRGAPASGAHWPAPRKLDCASCRGAAAACRERPLLQVAKLREQAAATRVSWDLPHEADNCCMAAERRQKAVRRSWAPVNKRQAEDAHRNGPGPARGNWECLLGNICWRWSTLHAKRWRAVQAAAA